MERRATASPSLLLLGVLLFALARNSSSSSTNPDEEIGTMTCDEIVARSAVDSPECELATQEGYLQVASGGSLPTSDKEESNAIYWKEYWDSGQDPAKTMPLLVVNGGPGGSHDYLLPLRYLACRASPSGTRYRIIFYDQLGSGKSSEKPTGEPQVATTPSVWYLTAELQAVVQGVVLAKNSGPFHLLGQGFGGLIALSYATTYPAFTQEKMASLILSSPAAPNVRDIAEGVVANMKAQMPALYFQVLMSGNTTDPAWDDALANYNNQMVLRLTPTPDCVLATDAASSYRMRKALWGVQPWKLTGNAAAVDLTPDLPRILVPVYAYLGQHDEYPQATLGELSGGTTHIPWIHTEVVPDAGHLTHIDNFAYVYSGLNKWLDDTDSQPYFQMLGGFADGGGGGGAPLRREPPAALQARQQHAEAAAAAAAAAAADAAAPSQLHTAAATHLAARDGATASTHHALRHGGAAAHHSLGAIALLAVAAAAAAAAAGWVASARRRRRQYAAIDT